MEEVFEYEDIVRAFLEGDYERMNEATLMRLYRHYKRPLEELGFPYHELTREQEEALSIKKDQEILVSLGNPPWDREEAVVQVGTGRGKWVRWNDGNPEKAILFDFVKPVKDAGLGIHLKNVYVYFWRWALWKVFDQKSEQAESSDVSVKGIVNLITARFLFKWSGFRGNA